MDKKQLMDAFFANEKPARVPVGFWHHFVSFHDHYGYQDPAVYNAVVNGQKKFIDEVDPDFLKIMSDGFFGHPSVCRKTIRTADDLAGIRSVGPDHPWITRQVEYVRDICNYAGDGLYKLYNVFSPLQYIRLRFEEFDEDFKKLIGCLDKSYYTEHRDYAMIMLMLDSGMRLGECSCLTMVDLNLAKRQIALKAEVTKGRKDRTVYFSSKTEYILRRWIQYKDRYIECDYLFPTRSNTGAHVSVSNFETNFKKYLKRVGMDETITPHCLRNNFAKRCLMNGMDIYTLSRILGHSSVTVTEQAYLDLTDDDIGRKYQNYSPISAIR